MSAETTNTKPGTGKLAVVTGASTGIGLELARQFAQNGFDLAIVSHSDQINAAADELSDLGVEVRPFHANLAKKGEVAGLYNSLKQLGRPIDAIALNAGVGVSGRFVEDISLEDDLNLISLNVTSIVHLAKLVLPEMVERKSGRVLITASIAGLMPGPFYATYAASKAFLLSFSEALYNELKDSGVTVTALLPGPTDTNFFERAGLQDTKAGQGAKDDPAQVAKDGFEAMMKGEDSVIAGAFTNKLQGFMSSFMSDRLKASIHRSMTEPKH